MEFLRSPENGCQRFLVDPTTLIQIPSRDGTKIRAQSTPVLLTRRVSSGSKDAIYLLHVVLNSLLAVFHTLTERKRQNALVAGSHSRLVSFAFLARGLTDLVALSSDHLRLRLRVPIYFGRFLRHCPHIHRVPRSSRFAPYLVRPKSFSLQMRLFTVRSMGS